MIIVNKEIPLSELPNLEKEMFFFLKNLAATAMEKYVNAKV